MTNSDAVAGPRADSATVAAGAGWHDDAVARGEWWRAVLGEYPTGVALITSVLPDGSSVGMIVGSFVAISQDPPLIGFFGDDASASFRQVVTAPRFAVSVLGEQQDGLLRAFIRKDPDRFDHPGLLRTASGQIRLDDAIAWFEGATTHVERHGDHQLVIASVTDFGVGTSAAGSPLVYRRGGFGSFAVPTERLDTRLLGERIAAAHLAADIVRPVAERLERDIAITTMVGDSVLALAMVPAQRPSEGSASKEDFRRAPGMSIPFAAPVEPVFAAWATERTRSLWIERARHLVGGVDRRRVEQQLAAIRARGFGASVDRELTERFYDMVNDPTAESDSYARVWSEYARRTVESNHAVLPIRDVAAIQVPVFGDADEVVLVLTVANIGPFSESGALEALAHDLQRSAAQISSTILQPRARV